MAIDVWSRLKRHKIGDFRIFSLYNELYQMPDGRTHDFYVMECGDWVNIVPVTGDGKVLLIKQFRAGSEEITFEIPGGMVEPGEDPEDAARRELKEETGYEATNMELIGVVEPNPAFIRNHCHMFLATGVTPAGSQNLDPGELIEYETATWEEIDSYIKNGLITHGLVLNALCFARYKDMRNLARK